MLFNSIEFALFLFATFAIYWSVPTDSTRGKNTVLLIASYIFYGFWDWRFLPLIILSSTVDFTVGKFFANLNQTKLRKLLLYTSIITNLGILGYFKYADFFISSFNDVLAFNGNTVYVSVWSVILPVGISFYTFQTMSYTFDVYRGKIKPIYSYLQFFTFVSFFPQLVAGPIERATNLLPQFGKRRVFKYADAVEGCRQILWGLFKKMVIADNCAQFVDVIFKHHTSYSGAVLLLGAVSFAWQIYGDFSGYSDIAIGTARLFGIRLRQNFSSPYFSKSLMEFWRSWHISLSTWFRDYLFIPLGGSKKGQWLWVRNIALVFIVSGFWHGANWTFIVWGAVHAIGYLGNRLTVRLLNLCPKKFASFFSSLSTLLTFLFVSVAWVFFRAESIGFAIEYLQAMLKGLVSLNTYMEAMLFLRGRVGARLLLVFAVFLLVEYLGRKEQYGLAYVSIYPKWVRWLLYYFVALLLFIFKGQPQEFIYFQF